MIIHSGEEIEWRILSVHTCSFELAVLFQHFLSIVNEIDLSILKKLESPKCIVLAPCDSVFPHFSQERRFDLIGYFEATFSINRERDSFMHFLNIFSLFLKMDVKTCESLILYIIQIFVVLLSSSKLNIFTCFLNFFVRIWLNEGR